MAAFYAWLEAQHPLYLAVLGIVAVFVGSGFVWLVWTALGRPVVDWFWKAPDLTDEHEHSLCIHPWCDVLLCDSPVGPCPDTAAVTCSHSEWVCDDHRAECCTGCQIDRADDAGLLDRGFGGWLR